MSDLIYSNNIEESFELFYVCYECDYHWGDIWGIK